MGIKYTTEVFIKKATEVHGELYDYRLVNYVGSKIHIKIICKEHGEFVQQPTSHLMGQGCRRCGNEKTGNINRHTKEQFIQKATFKHGNKYDYSLVDYKNQNTNVVIICPKHGEVTQRPADHLRHSGCTYCGVESSIVIRLANMDSFVVKAIKKHGDRYDYSLVDYIDSQTKVKIICKEHGVFEQQPSAHLTGQHCNKCAGVYSPTTEEFIQSVSLIHKYKYDYSLVEYKTTHSKVDIICPIHGVFSQSPADHKQGKGCIKCSRENNSISERVHGTEPATLYYVRLMRGGEVYYKIGVTKQTVTQRFKPEINKGVIVDILQTWPHDKGGDAYTWEGSILKVFRDFKTKDKPLHRKGNTEVFDVDILNLDKDLA